MAGSTTATVSISLNDDALVEPAETFIVTLSSPSHATISDATGTATLNDNDLALGAFSISGITGVSDSTQDAYLNGGLNPIVTWGGSASATSYDVTVYESDGTTVKCATQNTASTSYDFSSCNLTAGTSYKAKVTAKASGATSVDASNSLFSFNVNRAPTITTSGPWYVLSGGSIVINAQYAAAPSVGTAQDADGDTLVFSAVGTTGSGVGAATNNSTSVTYAANSYTGVETFTFTVSDGKGGAVSGTMTVYVVTAKTWTGGTSNTWTNADGGNWCGAVNTNKTGCTNAGTVPGASDVAIIDGTCTGPNCSPTVNYNVSVQGLKLGGSSLTQNAGNTITVGSSGWIQSGGSFTGSNANITYNGALSLSGGSYTATSATTNLLSHLTVSGSPSFSHNSGSFKVDIIWGGAAAILTPGNVVFNNFEFSGVNAGGSQRTLIGTLNVAGTLTLNSNNASWNSLVGGGTISAKGNVTAIGYGSGASTTVLKIDGNTNQTISGVSTASFLNLEIASTGGTVDFSGTMLFKGVAFTYTSGTVNAGASNVIFECLWSGGVKTLSPGSMQFNNVEFAGTNGGGNQLNLSGTMIVNGTLMLNSSSTFNYILSGGTISARGNVTTAAYGAAASTTAITVNGSGNQTISGVSTASFLDLEIASTGGTVGFSGTLYMRGVNFMYTSGTVNAGTSNVIFECLWSGGVKTISPGSMQFNNVEFAGSNGGGNQLNLSGTMIVNGTLTLNSSSSSFNYIVSGGTISARGNVIATNYGSSSSATLLKIEGSSSQTISGVSTARFLSMEIASTGGMVDFSGTLYLKNAAFTYTSGSVNSGTSSLVFEVLWGGGSKTISPGGLVFNNVEFSGSNGGSDQFSISGTMIVAGTLTFNSSSATYSNLTTGGAISARGDIVVSVGGNRGSTLVTMSGTGSATISQASGAYFPGSSLNLSKSGGAAVTLLSDFALSNTNQDLAINSETLDMAGFNLTVNRNITNSSVLQRGTNPTCGTVSQGGSFTGFAAICP